MKIEIDIACLIALTIKWKKILRKANKYVLCVAENDLVFEVWLQVSLFVPTFYFCVQLSKLCFFSVQYKEHDKNNKSNNNTPHRKKWKPKPNIHYIFLTLLLLPVCRNIFFCVLLYGFSILKKLVYIFIFIRIFLLLLLFI